MRRLIEGESFMVEYEAPGCSQEDKESRRDSSARLSREEARRTFDDESAETLAETFFQRGIRYSTGAGVTPDLVAAHKWFNLAALRGHEAARAYRNDLAREMSPREIAQAQREARECMRSGSQAQREGLSAARRRQTPARGSPRRDAVSLA